VINLDGARSDAGDDDLGKNQTPEPLLPYPIVGDDKSECRRMLSNKIYQSNSVDESVSIVESASASEAEKSSFVSTAATCSALARPVEEPCTPGPCCPLILHCGGRAKMIRFGPLSR
jgi:hypothetical protein